MLDNAGRLAATSPLPHKPNIEFYKIELAQLLDGNIFVGLTATSFDEQEPGLLNQEIVAEQVASLNDALTLVRAFVAFS